MALDANTYGTIDGVRRHIQDILPQGAITDTGIMDETQMEGALDDFANELHAIMLSEGFAILSKTEVDGETLRQQRWQLITFTHRKGIASLPSGSILKTRTGPTRA